MIGVGFYGWWITGASALILCLTVGIGLYVPPVFLVTLEEEFGWSRAAIAGGSSVAALTAGVLSPLVGVWIDRYGVRPVMVTGALIMGTGFALLGTMASLWQLYLCNLVAAAGIAGVAWIPNQTLIANWFVRRRGLAMGISLAGIGFGGLAMAPLAELLIRRAGWRMAFVGLALLILGPVVAIVLAVVRGRPAELGLKPDGEAIEAPDAGPLDVEDTLAGLELAQAVRTAPFWILSTCNFLIVFASLSVVAHLVAHLRDAGFGSTRAAASLGLVIGLSVAGRVVFGILADRCRKGRIMSLAMLLLAVGTLCLLDVGERGALQGFLVSFGLGLGGTAVLIPLLVGECFGLRCYGRLLGLIMISATLGAALGPILTGRIFDVTGGYRPAFLLHAALITVAAAAMGLLRSPSSPDVNRPEASAPSRH